MFENIDEGNFLLYAAKYYENQQCHDIEEFYDDIKRFKYLKRLFGKYEESGDLKERLILNHLVVLYNIFGDAATRMLFFKLSEYLPYLKPFLVLLNRLPDMVIISDDIKVITTLIPLDQTVVQKLRKI